MKTFKGFLLMLLALVLLVPSTVLGAPWIKLWVHGNYVDSDVPPFAENNRTLVPIRVISENLGYTVKWNREEAEKIVVEKDNLTATLTLGSHKISVVKDGVQKDLVIDMPAKVKNNRTFVPIRAIGELFGEKVDWDQENHTVIVGEGYKVTEEDMPHLSEMEKVVLRGLQEDLGHLFKLTYDPGQGMVILKPIHSDNINYFRHLTKNPNNPDYAVPWQDIASEMAALSGRLEKNSGLPFTLMLVHPDYPKEYLLLVQSGKIIDDFTKTNK